jgi:hypothetical protein
MPDDLWSAHTAEIQARFTGLAQTARLGVGLRITRITRITERPARGPRFGPTVRDVCYVQSAFDAAAGRTLRQPGELETAGMMAAERATAKSAAIAAAEAKATGDSAPRVGPPSGPLFECDFF